MKFIGAIDSAVPCAMLLDLANTLKPLLKQTFDKVNLLILIQLIKKILMFNKLV